MNSKFESLSLNELKAELKKRNAKVSGRKKELVERCLFPFYLPKYLPSQSRHFSVVGTDGGVSKQNSLLFDFYLQNAKLFYFHSSSHKESRLESFFPK